MVILVGLYVLVLTIMVIKAFEFNPFNLLLAVGAFIGYNRFVYSFPHHGIAIITTYGIAQWMIIHGYTKFILTKKQSI